MSDNWVLKIESPWPSKLTNTTDLVTLAANMYLYDGISTKNFVAANNIKDGQSLEIKSAAVYIFMHETASPTPKVRIILTDAPKKDSEMYNAEESTPPPKSYQYVVLESYTLHTSTYNGKLNLDATSIPIRVFGIKPYAAQQGSCTLPNYLLTLGDEHKYCKMHYQDGAEIICSVTSGSNRTEYNNLVTTVPPPPNTCTGYNPGGGSDIAWWIWLIIGLVVVVILVCIIFWMKKPKMTYRVYRGGGTAKIYQ